MRAQVDRLADWLVGALVLCKLAFSVCVGACLLTDTLWQGFALITAVGQVALRGRVGLVSR